MTTTNWRQNPNLVECFDNCAAMFRGASTPAPRKSKVAETIRDRRNRLGLSQAALADATGTSQANISATERGMWSPARGRIADTLDRLEAEKSVAVLVTGKP